PFALLDPASGQWQGLDVDMTTAMAKALGVKLELVNTSWSALMPDLLEDRFDIAAGGISVTLQRQKSAFFSTPILQDTDHPVREYWKIRDPGRNRQSRGACHYSPRWDE